MAKVFALVVSLCSFLVLAPHAQAQGPKFYYCYAPDPESGIVYVSETAPVGPVEERRQYGARFVQNLAARGLVPPRTQAYCVMRATEAEIDRGKADLRASCAECGGTGTFTDVAFAGALPSSGVANAGSTDDIAKGAVAAADESGSRRPAPAGNVLTGKRPDQNPPATDKVEEVPYEVAAPLPHNLFVQLIPRYEEAQVQVHYRFFLCGNKIYVSYSLRAVPARGVNQIRLSAVVTGNFITPFNFIQTAGMVPGHALGCAYQKYPIADLSDFEPRLVSGTFLDGTKVWSRKQMIEQLLGGFTMYAPAAPWPPGSQYADAPGATN